MQDASLGEPLEQQLELALKVRNGAQRMLALCAEQGDSALDARRKFEDELGSANRRIQHLEELLQSQDHLEQLSAPSVVTSLQNIQQAAAGPELLKELLNLCSILDRAPALAVQVEMHDAAQVLVPLLGDAAHKNVRSTAHKALRLFIADSERAMDLEAYHVDWLFIRSLSRDHKFDLEKQQVLLTVRHLLQLGATATTRLVPVSVLRAIVALAENSEDRLRIACLETLTELALRDVESLVAAEGMRVLLQALSDGPHELSPSITMVFLNLIDRPHLRAFFRPGVDLEIALAGLTDNTSSYSDRYMNTAGGHAAEERMRSSGRLITLMMRSWSGLVYLGSGERWALKSLVGVLSTASTVAKEIAMDTFFEIFRLKTPDWFNTFVAGKRLTLVRRPAVAEPLAASSSSSQSTHSSNTPASCTNLVDHYLCLIVVVFVEAGLLEGLVTIAESENPKLSRRAAHLIGELLQLSARLLPPSHNARIQALPRLFACVTSFDHLSPRLAANTALASVDSINRNRSRLMNIVQTPQDRSRSDSLEGPGNQSASIRLQIENTKARAGYNIDDATFRNQIIETGVLSNPMNNAAAFASWNVDLITDLLDGALINPRRMEEIIKGTKFLKRLIAFYHPLERKYSEMPKTLMNARYTKLGVTLISTLLSTAEGVKFLAEDKFLKQMADCLSILDPLSPSLSGDVLFTKKRCQNTMTGTYMEILAGFTRSEEGYRLLERFKIFTLLYHLTDLQSREDITMGFVEGCSYHIDGHTRNLLSKALSSNYPTYRFSATTFLETLLTQQLAASADCEWIIKLLVTQIYDPEAIVRELALRILENACQDSQAVLETFINLRPELDHLGYTGAPLLFRFLTSDLGVRYLDDIGYIDRGLEEWFYERNYIYAIQIEVQMSKLFSVPDATRSTPDAIAGALPFHFFGELAKTEEGRSILRASDHFSSFADYIREFGLEEHEPQILQQLKGILWAVGSIGASEGGLPFLDVEGIIPNIVEIAEDSLCFSIRGTCFYVLGLIASTPSGSEILAEYGWVTNTSQYGTPTGLCIPMDLSRILWNEDLYSEPAATFKSLPPPASPAERHLVTAIFNLANHPLASAASKILAKARTQQPELFLNPSMQYRVLHALEHIHFRLPVRRYLLDIFGISFEPASLSAIAAAGKVLNDVDDFAPVDIDRLPPTMDAKAHLGLGRAGWPSGQSEMLQEDSSMTDGGIGVGESANVLQKVVLEPVVQIKGFLVY